MKVHNEHYVQFLAQIISFVAAEITEVLTYNISACPGIPPPLGGKQNLEVKGSVAGYMDEAVSRTNSLTTHTRIGVWGKMQAKQCAKLTELPVDDPKAIAPSDCFLQH
ncbi:hypothetical protein KIN20_031031 [Parelaphostrongylus tenuis]|uniref:Uncharacterized protein n=1 Tax=Parelaphostrongylus tenuis TaxID=148309 RepID=A0AAD5WGW5_PARTN|nr:hypothetical protein KIN20_031031 [Parelaphostrongylus tenuis]